MNNKRKNYQEFSYSFADIKKKMKWPRLFTMYRKNDESGTSGTGRVLDGIIFHTGICVVAWRTPVSSVSVYDSFDHFKAIHIDHHPINKSEIIWLNDDTGRHF
jgi:hypothetical protein